MKEPNKQDAIYIHDNVEFLKAEMNKVKEFLQKNDIKDDTDVDAFQKQMNKRKGLIDALMGWTDKLAAMSGIIEYCQYISEQEKEKQSKTEKKKIRKGSFDTGINEILRDIM